MTVVEIDATYTKPFNTTAIMITPGQTTNVLITTNQDPDASGIMFPMAATPYLTSIFPFDNSTTLGFLRYKNKNNEEKVDPKPMKFPVMLPHNLPKMEDTPFATEFASKLRSLASREYPCNVPKSIDRRVITTVGLNLQDCPTNKTCLGYAGKRFFASMNNQSFVRPKISMLEGYYKTLTTRKHHHTKVYSKGFPEMPPQEFDYTGGSPFTQNMNAEFGTKILVVPYGTNLEIVLQGTSFLNVENHPIHVHGHNFFIVGKGFGNFDINTDPANYNLVDPPERNTVAVPTGGWAAIRLKADNPGVWFVHCHLEEHTSWGLAMAFIVENGPEKSQRLDPPPKDLPAC